MSKISKETLIRAKELVLKYTPKNISIQKFEAFMTETAKNIVKGREA